MAGMTRLLVATGRGVFAVPDNNAAGEPQLLGLQDQGGLRWILADRHDPARVWAASERGGVWRTDDGGRHWAEKNQGLVYKHTYSLAQHLETGDLYVGTEPACIFKSTDGAETWTELESLRKLASRKDWTFPGPPYVPHIKGIGLCRSDPEIIFGAVEEGWLVRSDDGGETWINIIEGTEFDSHTVTILPDDSGTIVSASGVGLYRSADGGESFARSDAGIEHPYLINVAVHLDRPRTLFTAGTKVPPPRWGQPDGPEGGFYRSTDAGLTWQRLTGGLPERIGPAPRSIAIDPEDPESVFIGLNDGEIWATHDGGEAFQRIASGLPPVLNIAPLGTE